MKVLMQNRSDVYKTSRGDTTQMLKTKEYLEKLGVTVDISMDYRIRLKGYDCVHLFNTAPGAIAETYLQCLNAKKQGVPVVLSPIYMVLQEYESFCLEVCTAAWWHFVINRKNLEKTLLNVRDTILNGRIEEKDKLFRRYGLLKLQQAVFEASDVILPNSQMEHDLIQKNFGTTRPYYIVPNAVDISFKNATADEFIHNHGIKDCLLCAGRIEPLKNQLSLIRALKGQGLTLVLIGEQMKTGLLNKSYSKKCKMEGEKNVIFLEQMTQGELASAYAAAKVHVQPSWFETTGLVSLEAGLAGCNIVITNRGYTKEYFKDFVWYCDPSDVSSIRNAVLGAYNNSDGRAKVLQQYILDNYTWEIAAQKTLDGYIAASGGFN